MSGTKDTSDGERSQSRERKEVVPDEVTDHLAHFAGQHLTLPDSRSGKRKVSSFGVYLGDFHYPLTVDESRLLQEWDLLIVDPFAEGTLTAISTAENTRFLGRVNLRLLKGATGSTITAIENITGGIRQGFNAANFSGILLAEWETAFSPSVLKQLIWALKRAGLEVYLETAPPSFLSDGKILRDECISGLVLRNASIMLNGEKRDYFQMTTLRNTIKAFVAEACMRDFVVMSWETVDNNVVLSNAVIRRALQWCNFYSVLTWIGPKRALTDASVNINVLEPISAFGWLKDSQVMAIHDIWRSNTAISSKNGFGSSWQRLAQLFPSLRAFLASKESSPSHKNPEHINLPSPPAWVSPRKPSGNPLSLSILGTEITGLGCFPLGAEVTAAAFTEILQSQQRLKNLGLLHPVAATKLQDMGLLLKQFHDSFLQTSNLSWHSEGVAAVKELSTYASNKFLRVNLGLDSGFRKDSENRFWAVYQADPDFFEVFLSKNAPGLVGTVLHTFLSSKGFPRHVCFEFETAFAQWSKDLVEDTGLPRRLVHDIDVMTPSELLTCIRHLSLADTKSDLVDNICAYIRQKLIDGPTLSQLKELNTTGYLSGEVSAEQLLHSRIAWYSSQNRSFPSFGESLELFYEVEHVLVQIMKNRREAELRAITEALGDLVKRGSINAHVDMLALSIFCATRKLAFDEIYAEVTDRNPLFNNQSDQAAAFAECFALGSRCEAYFDMSPSCFGKLLSDRFREYYGERQPPLWVNGAPELATAYAGAQIDVDPEEKAPTMPGYQRFTFLSIFAIPALIDIILLTFIGRGLYLSSWMSEQDVEMATIALMISLLLSGAIGTWISCGGSYYLVSMAFSAMNMFVLTRLIAGLGFTFLGAVIGFIVISCVRGPREAVLFSLYLIALTAYLTLFATIACYTFPSTPYLSGRKIILSCIPVLFLAPIITVFVGYDSLIYLIVLYVFLALLVLGLRATSANWATWYQKIRFTNDAEIRQWYIANYAGNNEKVLDSMTDPAALKMCREALLSQVLAERKKGFFTKRSRDGLVAELARDWDATNFLIDWYCRYADIPRPIPYSSGWNIQTKVALDTLRSAQKGIRLHNAFIHWRQSGAEVGCGILYFVIALLDKWVDLLCGGQLIGLTVGAHNPARTAIGLGLAYYLIGAVLLDTRAQHLHALLGKQTPLPIKSAGDIRTAQKHALQVKRRVYWKTLFKFLMWHVWSIALTGGLVWGFTNSLDAMIMYCAYVLAYTGLLWYQYTKIFSGPHAFKPLLASVVIALPVGLALRLTDESFLYSGVIALGVATWSVALMALWTAKLGMPRKTQSPIDLGRTFHAHVVPWIDAEWSQQELQTIYQRIVDAPATTRQVIDPQSEPGTAVKTLLLSCKAEPTMSEAFPNVEEMIQVAVAAWERDKVSVELVFENEIGPGIHALSCTCDDHLKILIAVGRSFNNRLDVTENTRIIAETLVHATAEALQDIPHEYAIFAESFVSPGITQTVSRRLREEQDPSFVRKWANNELIRQLCLGFQPDIHWDKLPSEIRKSLLGRCLGESCNVTETQWQWLEHSLCKFDTSALAVHISRCNLGCAISMTIVDYAVLGEEKHTGSSKRPNPAGYIIQQPQQVSRLRMILSNIWYGIGAMIKYLVMAIVAEPDFQREFNYVMKNKPKFISRPLILFLNVVWIYARSLQDVALMFFLFHKRDNVERLWKETKGMTVDIKRDRVIIQSPEGTFTAFKHPEAGGFRLCIYTGTHKSEPKDTKLLKYVNSYTNSMLLQVREEFEKGQLVNEYHYDYRSPAKRGFRLAKDVNPRIPLGRRCVRGKNVMQSIHYNRKGLVESGSYVRDGNLVRFKYHYRKNPRFGDELLRAEFVLEYMSCTVSWCAPPRRHPEKIERWIPHSKVTEATFVHGSDVYESRWLYNHRFHPTIFTSLNGQKIQTPPMIEFDHLGVLKKPQNTTFLQDNPLLFCDGLNTNFVTRMLGLTKKRFPVSTARARSLLWKAWKERVDFDGVIVRWLDEKLLRHDKVLAPYWRYRDLGDLASAKKYLDLRADAVMASADLDDALSGWTPLAMKLGDLFSFGSGGDAVNFTRSSDFAFDSGDKLHVMASDMGTWPNEGGGVSACRRDMINSLRTIKWHMICESANDFGTPKHQTEQNVQTLKVIPLWGLDFLTPTHGLFKNKLDAEVDDSNTSATDLDIKTNFVPILTALVKGARAVNLSNADIQQATRAFVNLNTYFDSFRHWGQVWTSEIVKECWRDLWLSQDMPNAVPSTQWFDTELPTLGHLDTALELWFRYLFIFSIPVPKKVPPVFQASHHSVSATYGVVCKIKRGCTLQIWDHAISWRETNLVLSSALSKLPPFVRNALLGLLRLTSVLILHHADIVSPCADFFNPGWEVEIGTSQGSLEHRNRFRRKVDPVVNGITDMQKFAPVKEIKSPRPTVTMLSHVWYAKDIKTAILAADLIINHWKFDDYYLDIYGAIDKAPTYSTECQELIASKGLRGRVTLRGTADPMKVLENTWLFLNSSLSEGLPLALGEAALTGAPVVCTDVGASLRVLSDPDDFSRYSAVVAPNDALALARAQINMLAMLGEWSKYADDPEPVPELSSSPTPEEVAAVTRRMYEKSEHRRKLGMMTRGIVQKSFSGERYLREHEQMLWVGKSMKALSSGHRGTGIEDKEKTEGTVSDEAEAAMPVDEEVITIPRNVVVSWRTSASVNSSAYSQAATSRGSMVRGSQYGRSLLSSDQSYSSTESGKHAAAMRKPFLPIFAPRVSDPSSTMRSSTVMGPEEVLQGLRREELRQYRNSDVSSFMRDEFWNSNAFGEPTEGRNV